MALATELQDSCAIRYLPSVLTHGVQNHVVEVELAIVVEQDHGTRLHSPWHYPTAFVWSHMASEEADIWSLEHFPTPSTAQRSCKLLLRSESQIRERNFLKRQAIEVMLDTTDSLLSASVIDTLLRHEHLRRLLWVWSMRTHFRHCGANARFLLLPESAAALMDLYKRQQEVNPDIEAILREHGLEPDASTDSTVRD